MENTPDTFLNTARHTFLDNQNRAVILRGVNLSGSSKFPASQPSYQLNGLWEEAENGGSSFVNRPLNLDDGSADVHLARLRGWGLRILRYVVVWEALEHEGPGKYDNEFIQYTVRALQKCREYGFRVYIDPHQDCWSRFSGGSGAPYWTLNACGLDPRGFTATNAAVLHAEFPNAETPDPTTYPAMVWQTNLFRLAAATVFTMFFGGKSFAPKCMIDGINIQDYLQHRWTEAFGRLADAIAEYPDLLDDCVLGWDSMNEPAVGWIGLSDLSVMPEGQTFKKYTTPTPVEAMRLGMGHRVEVETWDFGSMGPTKTGTTVIDPKGRLAWLDPSSEPEGKSTRWGWQRGPEWKLGLCPWAQHGVWDVDSGDLLATEHFRFNAGTRKEANFDQDYWHPYWQSFSKRLRNAHPNMISFIAPPVFHAPPQMREEDVRGRGCLTPHYYDGLTLLSKSWHAWNAHSVGLERGKLSMWAATKLGTASVRRGLHEQLQELRVDALAGLSSQSDGGPEYPAIIGEIGVPFDMEDSASYRGTRKGDYSEQEKALDASLNACDGENGLGYTLWTYTPDNSHLWGDGFNGEDLSLWSLDDCTAQDLIEDEDTKPLSSPGYRPKSLHELLTNGARALRAFCRPYPLAILGEFKHLVFDMDKPEFELTIKVGQEHLSNANEDVATEIYVPFVHFVLAEEEEEWKECCPPPHLQRMRKYDSPDPNTRKLRLLGAVDPNEALGLQHWRHEYARLDIQVEVTLGDLEAEGQVLRWKYAGVPGLKAGTELKLLVRRGSYDLAKDEKKGLVSKLMGR